MKKIYIFIALFSFILFACAKDKSRTLEKVETLQKIEEEEMDFKLTSKSFGYGEAIPAKFTCKVENISPQLSWTAPPDNTVELALICDDPDAPRGVWSHWVVFGLPSTLTSLEEGANNIPGIIGINDFGENKYGGPCPPPGKPHRYFFRLYALDKKLELKSNATREIVLEAMEGHIIAKAELMGLFSR